MLCFSYYILNIFFTGQCQLKQDRVFIIHIAIHMPKHRSLAQTVGMANNIENYEDRVNRTVQLVYITLTILCIYHTYTLISPFWKKWFNAFRLFTNIFRSQAFKIFLVFWKNPSVICIISWLEEVNSVESCAITCIVSTGPTTLYNILYMFFLELQDFMSISDFHSWNSLLQPSHFQGLDFLSNINI